MSRKDKAQHPQQTSANGHLDHAPVSNNHTISLESA
jgi:hypothetical protein